MADIIKKDGNHRVTVKRIGPIATILNNIRKPSPQKGTKNPPHIHIKGPRNTGG